MTSHLNHHNCLSSRPIDLVFDDYNHIWQSFSIANLLLADNLLHQNNDDDNSNLAVRFSYIKSSLSYKFASCLIAADWSIYDNFWIPNVNYQLSYDSNDTILPLLEKRKSSGVESWLAGRRIRMNHGNILIPCSTYFKLHYWSNDKLYLLHPYSHFLYDDCFQQEQIAKYGVVLFNDLPAYVLFNNHHKLSGLFCRLRLRVSKLRTDLQYRHIPVAGHIGLPAADCLVKCPLCTQAKLLDYVNNQRRFLLNLFGNNYPFINQLLPSSLNDVGNDQRTLSSYILSNVEDDTVEHLLFKCPVLDIYRTAFDIPSVVNNENVKLLLGQIIVDNSRWKQILSFYDYIIRLRPELC